MKVHTSLILFLVLILAFLFPLPVSASNGGIFYGDSIPAGVILDHDVVLFGENVDIEGSVNGNVFILANQVVMNGDVDGNLILIAQNASLSGSVTSSIYALALTLDLPVNAQVARDLYAATVSLTSGKGSSINRHLYAIGLDAGLNGQIGGELHTALGPLQLYNGLMRLLGFDELTLELHIETPVQEISPQGSALSPIRHLRLKLSAPLPAIDWKAWGMDLWRNFGTLFLLGILVYWLARKHLNRAGIPLSINPLKALGIGLLVLVVSFNLFIVALLLFILFFAIGLGFNFLGLWQIAMILWLVLFAVLIMAVLCLVLFIAFGAKLIVVYFYSSWLLRKIISKENLWLDLAALLIGSLVLALLRSISYAGWIIDLLVTAAGMGSFWLAFKKPISPIKAGNISSEKNRRKK